MGVCWTMHFLCLFQGSSSGEGELTLIAGEGNIKESTKVLYFHTIPLNGNVWASDELDSGSCWIKKS